MTRDALRHEPTGLGSRASIGTSSHSRLNLNKIIIQIIPTIAIPKPGVIEEVVDLARQISLEVDSDEVQELLDSHNQKLTIDELIEMQEQYLEELESLRPSTIRRSNDA
ncbi:hypothetical protein TNCV_2675561 [Trichonephila clavipes]|nr:hypothetical protein TNCV_2675561 [Trichonephila clavipes]